ncbi:MAG: sel1 repeat family protein [Bacteriovoracaceae bacterium]|nr:sel1 repeat family protein [Bacteriovoracaceae bacterium]
MTEMRVLAEIANNSNSAELLCLFDEAMLNDDKNGTMVFSWFLACGFANGKDIKVDKKNAFKYMKVSAGLGNSAAEFQLGLFYIDDSGEFTGAPSNVDIGKKWVVESAKNGYSHALEALPNIIQVWRFSKANKIKTIEPSSCKSLLNEFAYKLGVEKASIVFNDEVGLEIHLEPIVGKEPTFFFVAFEQKIYCRVGNHGTDRKESLIINAEISSVCIKELNDAQGGNTSLSKKYIDLYDKLLVDLEGVCRLP